MGSTKVGVEVPPEPEGAAPANEFLAPGVIDPALELEKSS